MVATSIVVWSAATTALAKDDPNAADPNAADLARMQGDWMVATMQTEGMEVPAEEAQALFRTVENDTYTVSRYAKVASRGTFQIDATKSPKTIDSTPAAVGAAAPPADGKAKPPQTIRGIYEFDGDKLRICNARPGQPRPKNFEAKQYTGHTLIVWEPEVK
ncbi:MAG: TIGR03067 domain-containing protein [Pirellulales bacterium]